MKKIALFNLVYFKYRLPFKNQKLIVVLLLNKRVKNIKTSYSLRKARNKIF
jgi:hypothetical protein